MQQHSKEEGNGPGSKMQLRMQKPVGYIGHQSLGLGQHIPAVPALETPQVHAERSGKQDQRGDGHLNSGGKAKSEANIHLPQAAESQSEAGQGIRENEQGIEPKGNGRRPVQVDEIGYNVGRIGKKGQPGQKPKNGFGITPVSDALQKTVGKKERYQGQKQIPVEEDVPWLA